MGVNKPPEFANSHLGVRHHADRQGQPRGLDAFSQVCYSFCWHPEKIQHISKMEKPSEVSSSESFMLRGRRTEAHGENDLIQSHRAKVNGRAARDPWDPRSLLQELSRTNTL